MRSSFCPRTIVAKMAVVATRRESSWKQEWAGVGTRTKEKKEAQAGNAVVVARGWFGEGRTASSEKKLPLSTKAGRMTGEEEAEVGEEAGLGGVAHLTVLAIMETREAMPVERIGRKGKTSSMETGVSSRWLAELVGCHRDLGKPLDVDRL